MRRYVFIALVPVVNSAIHPLKSQVKSSTLFEEPELFRPPATPSDFAKGSMTRPMSSWQLARPHLPVATSPWTQCPHPQLRSTSRFRLFSMQTPARFYLLLTTVTVPFLPSATVNLIPRAKQWLALGLAKNIQNTLLNNPIIAKFPKSIVKIKIKIYKPTSLASRTLQILDSPLTFLRRQYSLSADRLEARQSVVEWWTLGFRNLVSIT